MEIVAGAMNAFTSLLVDEYKLPEGAKHDIVFLLDELESMQAALVMISEVPFSQLDDQVKAWARDVRELSYDMEDNVDAFMVQAQATREPNQQPDPDGSLIKGFIDRIRSLWTMAMIRHQIAVNIRRIKKDVEDVSERRKRYKLASVAAKSTITAIDPRLPALYEDVGKLVGIHEPRDELVKLLKGEEDAGLERELKVVTIVGVGGLVERLAIGPDGFRCLTQLQHNTMELTFAPGAMPRLEKLMLRFRVRETKDRHGNFDFGMNNLPQLSRDKEDSIGQEEEEDATHQEDAFFPFILS
ncbi:hypothetical protein E2562_026800 [Oryza meyeriana var. granulata]|uniref:Uncharacterized protein n=1 Tax=Oryza meyeriana var. granulata TaxID=110450 RepID=A0A6G1CJW9_9ORYZ|nr:hypothetical protein E2562_026800 [Oryza meyeriana var. granulata]